MEYVDGEDLASLLRRIGRFPEDRALEIARQICAGLAAAHERGVVHRDLKPANIMLDGTGRVRITDFGLAGASGEAIRAGTPAYMAPEQLAGGEVTARSDIYSLGLVLYEIFTGQRALEGTNLAELIHKREQSGILPPTPIVKSLDPKIERAIMRCLKPQPAARPASALAVAAAFPAAIRLRRRSLPAKRRRRRWSPPPASAVSSILRLDWGWWPRRSSACSFSPRWRIARVSLRLRPDAALSRLARGPRARGGGTSGIRRTGHDSARGLPVNYEYLSYISRTDNSATRWQTLKERQVASDAVLVSIEP